ncbi:hypothetical protein [Marinifilum fragile]|uniref:hypothetical protein n=1 Tax=Marinifilum fragile TaxID=570161 RepID=UPI0006CF822A|nr:hypothetical protein [Marinifilum fragile]
MKRKQFIQELIQNSTNQVQSEDYKITKVAKSGLDAMIITGVQSMTINDLSSIGVRSKVKRNIQLFIKAMTIDSKRRFMLEHLEYRSFVNARFEIKTLWPFY